VETGTAICLIPLAADRWQRFSFACPTSPLKTRVRVFSGGASGRLSRRSRRKRAIATGCGGCGYKTASGRAKWLSRDPIGEAGFLQLVSDTSMGGGGSPTLYGFLGNDGINQIDDLGLMKDSDIDAYVKGLDAVVSPNACCCILTSDDRRSLTLTLKESGQTVTGTANFQKDNCVLFVDKYFWWNCVNAQAEYKQIVGWRKGSWDIARGDEEWKHYGWQEDGSTYTQSHEGNSGYFGRLTDAGKWNWAVRVVYVSCDPKRQHAHSLTSDYQELKWVDVNIRGQGSWAPPVYLGGWEPE